MGARPPRLASPAFPPALASAFGAFAGATTFFLGNQAYRRLKTEKLGGTRLLACRYVPPDAASGPGLSSMPPTPRRARRPVPRQPKHAIDSDALDQPSRGTTRRQALSASAALAAAPFVNRSRCRLFGQSAEYSARAVHLIRDSLVIDMLDQFLYRKDRQPTLRAWLTKAGAFTEADLFHESSGGDGRAGAGVLGARGAR